MNNEMFSKADIYILNHWFSSNEKDVFVFIGNDDTGKTYYKKDKNTRNIIFIKENIFSFNNVIELKTKIGYYCMKSLGDNEVYCWCKTKLD